MKMDIFAKSELQDWLISQDTSPDVAEILLSLCNACKEISATVQVAALEGHTHATTTVNVQGEVQKALDVISNDIVLAHLANSASICAMVSEENADLIVNPHADADAQYAVCFDPLDGSTNIETNSSIGTIFSVLQVERNGEPVTERDVLGAAKNQVAAGYVFYGSATILVLTTGKSVSMFVLDPKTNSFMLVSDNLVVPQVAAEFSINAANARFWEPALATFIDHCVKGETGPRAKDFNMRWSGAMVADVHRLFVRGGIFIYPALDKPGGENGKLRFLYEANPMAMLVETAGGVAQIRTDPILDFKPASLHQRVPVVLGSREKVDVLNTHYNSTSI